MSAVSKANIFRTTPRRWAAACLACLLLLLTLATVLWQRQSANVTFVAPSPAQTPLDALVPAPSSPAASPAAPSSGIEVIGYDPAPAGFPADPDPYSTTALIDAAHPTERLLAYDAPNGTPLAYLAPTISGVSLVMPIVSRQGDWVAVLLPSANRTICWLAPNGWESVSLRDQIVIQRSTHKLTWLRDGVEQGSWTVALGASATPTPIGRTFVLGRSAAHGKVYAGLDVLALGALPENVDALPSSLKSGHIGIHSWYSSEVFGKNISNGCVRVPPAGHKRILAGVSPGTEVVIVD